MAKALDACAELEGRRVSAETIAEVMRTLFEPERRRMATWVAATVPGEGDGISTENIGSARGDEVSEERLPLPAGTFAPPIAAVSAAASRAAAFAPSEPAVAPSTPSRPSSSDFDEPSRGDVDDESSSYRLKFSFFDLDELTAVLVGVGAVAVALATAAAILWER